MAARPVAVARELGRFEWADQVRAGQLPTGLQSGAFGRWCMDAWCMGRECGVISTTTSIPDRSNTNSSILARNLRYCVLRNSKRTCRKHAQYAHYTIYIHY
eukprot:6173256-Pleurochrysis_carterae.AAC.3